MSPSKFSASSCKSSASPMTPTRPSAVKLVTSRENGEVTTEEPNEREATIGASSSTSSTRTPPAGSKKAPPAGSKKKSKCEGQMIYAEFYRLHDTNIADLKARAECTGKKLQKSLKTADVKNFDSVSDDNQTSLARLWPLQHALGLGNRIDRCGYSATVQERLTKDTCPDESCVPMTRLISFPDVAIAEHALDTPYTADAADAAGTLHAADAVFDDILFVDAADDGDGTDTSSTPSEEACPRTLSWHYEDPFKNANTDVESTLNSTETGTAVLSSLIVSADKCRHEVARRRTLLEPRLNVFPASQTRLLGTWEIAGQDPFKIVQTDSGLIFQQSLQSSITNRGTLIKQDDDWWQADLLINHKAQYPHTGSRHWTGYGVRLKPSGEDLLEVRFRKSPSEEWNSSVWAHQEIQHQAKQ